MTPPALTITLLTTEHAAQLFPELCASAIYDFIPGGPPADVASLALEYARLLQGCPRPDELWLNWVAYRDAQAVATLQATVFANQTASIGYVVFPRFWGHGIGKAGVLWLVDELRRRNVHTVRACVDPNNLRSLRVLASTGFHEIATDDVSSDRWLARTIVGPA